MATAYHLGTKSNGVFVALDTMCSRRSWSTSGADARKRRRERRRTKQGNASQQLALSASVRFNEATPASG